MKNISSLANELILFFFFLIILASLLQTVTAWYLVILVAIKREKFLESICLVVYALYELYVINKLHI